jgi:hypothetical protein
MLIDGLKEACKDNNAPWGPYTISPTGLLINAFFFWWPHLLVRTFIELAMLRIFLFSLGLTEFRVQHHGTFQFPPFINLF